MVQEINLVIKNNSIEVNPISGSIISTVYFRIGNKTFPDEGWSDFTVIILGWWIEQLSNLKAGSKSFRLKFMDGPLYVKGLMLENNRVKLEFLKERQNNDEVFFCATCDFNQLEAAIHIAAKEFLKELEKRDIKNNDIKKINNYIA